MDISQKTFLIVSILFVLGAGFLFFAYKKEIALFAWNNFYVFPSYALSLNNTDAFLARSIGDHYFNINGKGTYNLDTAESYYKKALEIDPLVSDVWHQLARIHFLIGNFPEALEKINTQINLHGDSFMASYYIRGLIYGYAKQFDKSESDFRKFLSWDKRNWAAHNDLAWVYFQQGEYEKARATAIEGLEYGTNNPWLLNMVGIASFNLGDMKMAQEYLEKALEEAEKLTEYDWHKAYPGNNPDSAQQGIFEMKKAIRVNLDLLVDN